MSYIGTTEIGKMYFGTTRIAKAYLGSTLVFEEGSTPPTPVTNIPYLRNSNLTEYIDTGITADNTTRVIVWARNFNPCCSWFFGSRSSSSTGMFVLCTTSGSGVAPGSIRYYFDTETGTVNDCFTNLSWYHKYELSANELYIDDVLIGSLSSSTFENNLNIYLFGVNDNGTAIFPKSPMDICFCKIYKGGSLVRDMTATSSGMYDAVSNTTFTNAGSGTFTYGTFAPDAFTAIEYIGCEKAQYFDTGVYGSYADQAIVKFRPTETTAQLYEVFGTVDSSTPSSARVTIGAGSSLNNRAYWSFGTNTTTVSMYNSTSPRLTNLDIIFYKLKSDRSGRLYRNNATTGSTATPSASTSPTTFVTTNTMWMGYAPPNYGTGRAFRGRYYYAAFGTTRNFVPAKVNNVAGMYETYNDVFYASTSGTDFIAGPEL